MKREINLWEYAGTILEQTGKAALLTAKANGRVNSMVIGWGTLGIEWGKPIYTVFVRESRFTKQLLDENPEFTVNIPLNGMDPEILSVCGRESGKDVDKVSKLGLTLEQPLTGSVPGIRQVPLTLECKVIYRQDQDPAAIAPENDQRYYAKGTANENDYHTAYYGQVMAAYIIEP